MRRNTVLTLAATLAALAVTGCTSDTPEYQLETKESLNKSYTLSPNEAVGIAEGFMLNETRSVTESPEIIPVLNNIKTRSSKSGLTSDTAAYILNYPESKMFAIIANDKRVDPVLAFSEDNVFDISNQTVRECFLYQIPSYLDAEISAIGKDYPLFPEDSIKHQDPVFPDKEEYVGPYLTTVLNQNAPYNKYMYLYGECTECHQQHPAGCVPTAMIGIVSHALPTLMYNGSFYNFKQINSALAEGSDRKSPTYDNPYTYETAVDATARLLYDFGKSIPVHLGHYPGDNGYINPTTFAYEASTQSAMDRIAGFGCNVSPRVAPFDCEKAVEYLRAKNLLLIRGDYYDSTGGGHQWVVDGFKIIPPLASGPNVDAYRGLYLHCDFGWGGGSNGYYKPLALKELKLFNYGLDYFYAVKLFE